MCILLTGTIFKLINIKVMADNCIIHETVLKVILVPLLVGWVGMMVSW